MATAYSYTRVSTPEQIKGDGIKRQIEKAELYAAQHGLELDTTLHLSDKGVSAYHGDNFGEDGALGSFVKLIGNVVPVGSYLLVEALDRISRENTLSAMNRFDALSRAGIHVVTLMDNKIWPIGGIVDLSDLMVSMIHFAVANQESAKKSVRGLDNWSKKRKDAKEKPLTKSVPSWIRIVDDKLLLIPERSAVVQQVFKLYLSGNGAAAIAKQLNDTGVAPWDSKGRGWYDASIRRLLSNRACIGELQTYSRTIINGKYVNAPQQLIIDYYPSAISEDIFNRAAELRNCKAIKGRKPQSFNNFFSRIAKCPACGLVMTIRGSSEHYRYICCGGYKQGICKAKTGKAAYINYNKILPNFIQAIRYALADFPNSDKNHNQHLKELRRLRVSRTNIDKALSNLTTAIEQLDDVAALNSLVSRISALEQQRIDIDKDISDIAHAVNQLSPTVELMRRKSIIAELESAEPDYKRVNMLLHEITDKIYLHSTNDCTVYFKSGQALYLNFSEGAQVRQWSTWDVESEKVSNTPI